MKVINTELKPIKMWLDEIEDWALEQAKNLANLPFIHKWVAIMPDSHQWYGMPIGWVIATKGVIIPNAVGVDIWCGMCVQKIHIKEISNEYLKLIMWKIREVVPVWFNRQKERQVQNDNHINRDNYMPIIQREYNSSQFQLWTLWGWNHFIEIQKWDDWFIYVMIHSGSRNLGKQVADNYNKIAEELNEKWHSNTQKELAFLPVDSEEWKAYIREMEYCVEFAFENRKLIMSRIIDCFEYFLWKLETDELINIAHNYARIEHHLGLNVRIHRKGATSARTWEIWIIPGSQWTCSYIVEWLWNVNSFTSCSHWAGRKMSRTKAQEELSLEDEIKKMDDLWVIHWIRNKSDLDEAAWAYKDIDIVMENQKDLVKILVKLIPLWVIKW